jgi:hypothetical protein
METCDPKCSYYLIVDPHQRIRHITLIRIRMRIRILILLNAAPDPTFHPDANPDPTFQILEKVLK